MSLLSNVNQYQLIELRTIDEVIQEPWSEFSAAYGERCSCCHDRKSSNFLVSLKNGQKFANLSKSCLDIVLSRMDTSVHRVFNEKAYRNLKSCQALQNAALFKKISLNSKCQADFTFLVTIGKITELEVKLYKAIPKRVANRTEYHIQRLNEINSIVYKTFNEPYSNSEPIQSQAVNININTVVINLSANQLARFAEHSEVNLQSKEDMWKSLSLPQAILNGLPSHTKPPLKLMSQRNINHFDSTLLHLPLPPAPPRPDSSLSSSICSSFGNKTGVTEFAPVSTARPH